MNRIDIEGYTPDEILDLPFQITDVEGVGKVYYQVHEIAFF